MDWQEWVTCLMRDDGNNIRILQELGKESEKTTLRMLVKGISDISEKGFVIRANAPNFRMMNQPESA